MAHISEYVLESKAVSSIRFAEKQNLLVSGDLTSVANAEAAMVTKSDAKPVYEQNLTRKARNSVKLANNLSTGFGAGGSIGDLDTLFPNMKDSRGNYLN